MYADLLVKYNRSESGCIMSVKSAMEWESMKSMMDRLTVTPNAVPSASERVTSPLIWLVRNDGIEIYRNGEFLGVIPKRNFLLLIKDMAELLDR
jgi:hypothetical protein